MDDMRASHRFSSQNRACKDQGLVATACHMQHTCTSERHCGHIAPMIPTTTTCYAITSCSPAARFPSTSISYFLMMMSLDLQSMRAFVCIHRHRFTNSSMNGRRYAWTLHMHKKPRDGASKASDIFAIGQHIRYSVLPEYLKLTRLKFVYSAYQLVLGCTIHTRWTICTIACGIDWLYSCRREFSRGVMATRTSRRWCWMH